MTGRLVILGQAAGRDAIVADGVTEAVPLAPGGVTAHLLWGRDAPATLPDAGEKPDCALPFPPTEGFRMSALTIPAGASDHYHAFVVGALGSYADPTQPGTHWTPTVDCIVIHKGEVVLASDEGEAVLGPGDSAIINGNRHRWTNRGDEDVVLFAFQVGAVVPEHPSLG